MQISNPNNACISHLTRASGASFTRHPPEMADARTWPGTGILYRAVMLLGMLLLAAVMATPLVAAPADSGDAAAGPTVFVKSVIDQATAIVRDTSMSAAERDRKLRAIAEANFNFSDMARTALGYHWRQLTPQQRAQFVPLFTSFMEAVYLSKMQDYGIEKIRKDVNTSNVNFTGQDFQGGDYAEVHSTTVFSDHPQPVKVDYLLSRGANGWKIYDLEIDGISVMANYRNQFNRVINDDGFPALTTMLQKKTRELESDAAKAAPHTGA